MTDSLDSIFDDLLCSDEQSATVHESTGQNVNIELPAEITNELNFKKGDKLKICVGDGVLVLSK